MAHPDAIPVVEIFGPTIQGEGAMIGKLTFFVRTAGCDYRCTHCDSMFAVDATVKKGSAKIMSAEEVVDAILLLQRQAATNVKWVTLSGGNPALCNFEKVIVALHGLGYKVAIETQGSVWRDWMGLCDQITISPKGPGMGISCGLEDLRKTMKEMHNLLGRDWIMSHAVFKIPVFTRRDLYFAQQIHDLWYIPMYLSVGNLKPDMNTHGHQIEELRAALLYSLETIFEDIKLFPGLQNCILLPQLHVLIWGNKQGV